MDTFGSFTSQCIAKASLLPPVAPMPSMSQAVTNSAAAANTAALFRSSSASSTSSVSSTLSPPSHAMDMMCCSSMLCPSEQQTKDSLEGEDDIWICDVCNQLNPGRKVACMLCFRDRDASLAFLAAQEISLSNEFEDEFSGSLKLWNAYSRGDLYKPIVIDSLSSSDKENRRNDINTPATGIHSSVTFNEMNNGTLAGPRGNSPGNDFHKDMEPDSCLDMHHGGSPKMDMSFDSGLMEDSPAGASPLCNYASGTSNFTFMNYLPRETSLSNDSFDDDDDDTFLMNLPNQIGPFECPHPGCSMILEDSKTLQMHSAQHKWGPHELIVGEDGVQYFHCRYNGCDKVLNDRKSLKKHMLTHREKVFACHYPDCDRKFYERAKLKRHFLVHTGEKPFVCPFEDCGKRFGYNANLKTHMRTHTGNRPFACTVANCRRRFAQASNRNNHMLTHQKHVEATVKKARGMAKRRQNNNRRDPSPTI